MQSLLQDIRYGSRKLIREPGLALIVILTLTLGISANVVVFSLAEAVLFRPMAAKDPARIVALWQRSLRHPDDYSPFSYPEYLSFVQDGSVFSGTAAFCSFPFSISSDGQPERIGGQLVSSNFFSVLGVDPVIGRSFLAAEGESPGTSAVAVISYRLWMRRFAGSSAVLGRELRLNRQDLRIIGVAPKNFRGADLQFLPDVWAPLVMFSAVVPQSGSTDIFHSAETDWLTVLARLKPETTTTAAQAQATLLAHRFHQQRDSGQQDEWTVDVLSSNQVGFRPAERRSSALILALVMGVVGAILLIACANVAGILLANMVSRQGEFAVRTALGARSTRLVRQVLTESVLLAACAGVVALAVQRAIPALIHALPLPPVVNLDTLDFSLTWRSLAYTIGLAVVTAVVCGVIPARQTITSNLALVMHGGSALPGRRSSRLRDGLLVIQIALSFILLVTAGLFIRSMAIALARDPGFDPKPLVIASVDLRRESYEEPEARRFYDQLLERVTALPAVQSVSLTRRVPLSIDNIARTISVERQSNQLAEVVNVKADIIAPGYFRTLGIGLLSGRDFTSADKKEAPGVVIVSSALARRLWPRQEAVGRYVRLPDKVRGGFGERREVVGVVADTMYSEWSDTPVPHMYLPFSQNYQSPMTLVVRTAADPGLTLRSIEREFHALDSLVPVFDAKPMAEQVRTSLWAHQLASRLLGAFGLLAFFLAMAGTYGSVSYGTACRTREIGVRMALGAQRGKVLQYLLGRAMFVVLSGIGLGLVGTALVVRVLSAALFGISGLDPGVLFAVVCLLVAVSAIATYVPVRRATKLDPLLALKYE